MNCTNCGTELESFAKFCTVCGTPARQEPAPAPAPEPVPVAEPVRPIEPVRPVEPIRPVAPAAPVRPVPVAAPVSPVQPAAPVIPKEYRLMGPWAYFGLQILFSIPLIGFICLIVFSLDNNRLNRRNFARSYWCSLIVSLVFTIILLVLVFALVGVDNLAYMLESIPL